MAFDKRQEIKRAIRRVNQAGFEPTQEESYDFFTKGWETRKDVRMELPEDDSDDEDDEESTEDKKKLLAKDFIGDKYDWQLTEFRGPEIQEPKSNGTFVPSGDHVDIALKLEAGQQPRFPEEEGMYIGQRPTTARKCQNRLERRYNYKD